MQIVVLGAHRSGTSLVTRLVNMMGAFFDSGLASIGFNDENPKGFWERSDVISVNDRLLKLQECRWDRLAHWKTAPTTGRGKASPELDAIQKDLKSIILTLDANRPWVVKDPRMCMTFAQWRPHLEVPVVICVHRDPLEVAMSLKTRNGFSFAHGIAIWEYYTVHILNSIRGLPVIHLEHKNIIADPVGTVKKLHESLLKEGVQGLRLPSDKEITSFIEPSLYRSKLQPKDYDEGLTMYQRQLGEMLAGRQPLPETPLEPSLTARDAMEVYEKAVLFDIQLNQLNERSATAEQEVNELRDFRQKLLNEVQIELARIRREVEVKEQTIRALRASKSWKLGNLLVRLVTLRWMTRPETSDAR